MTDATGVCYTQSGNVKRYEGDQGPVLGVYRENNSFGPVTSDTFSLSYTPMGQICQYRVTQNGTYYIFPATDTLTYLVVRYGMEDKKFGYKKNSKKVQLGLSTLVINENLSMSEQMEIGGCLINFTRKECLANGISYPLKSMKGLPLFDEESNSFTIDTLNDDIHYVCVICICNPFTSFDFIFTYLHELNFIIDDLPYIRSGDISSPFYVFKFNITGNYTKYINFSDLSNGLKDMKLRPISDSDDSDVSITLHMHTVILLSTDSNSSDYMNTILSELDDKYLDKYNGNFETWFNNYVKYEDSNNKCQILN